MDIQLLDKTAATYNELPYQSKPFASSHPALLQGIARLFGIDSGSVKKARVLELGCASGGNLIPLVDCYPDIELVGVDLSAVQIAEGQRLVKELGLEKQISLHCMSITDIPEFFGKFDYIICHGVYSWVPDFVQDGIFQVIQNHLNETGLAYISYNVYPGWKSLEIARDSMLFHTRKVKNEAEKIKHARVMIDFMQQNARKGTMFQHIVDNAQSIIQKSQDYYIGHEFLELHNSPCYFIDMTNKAKGFNLAYLSDVNLSSGFAENWGEKILDELLRASDSDQIVLEQYIDYMTNRQFRQSIFMHQSQVDKLNRRINGEKIKKLNFLAHIEKEVEPSEDHPDSTCFTFKQQATNFYRTKDPKTIHMLEQLSTFNNQVFSFSDAAKVISKEHATADEQHILAQLLQQLVILGLLTPFGEAPVQNAALEKVSEKPMLSEINRQSFATRQYLVNSTLQFIGVDAISVNLIAAFDGKHDKEALVDVLYKATEDEKVYFQRTNPGEDTPITVTDPKEIRELCRNYVNNLINVLQRHGAFVA